MNDAGAGLDGLCADMPITGDVVTDSPHNCVGICPRSMLYVWNPLEQKLVQAAYCFSHSKRQ